MPKLQLQVKKENAKDWSILARREYFGENQKLEMTKELEDVRDGWQRKTDMFVNAQFQIMPEARQPKPKIIAPVIEEPTPPVVVPEMRFIGKKSPRKSVTPKPVVKKITKKTATKKVVKKTTKKSTKKSKGRK